MLDSLKLKLKRIIGSLLGYSCPVCGKPMEEYGYNFYKRCSDPDCLSNEEARERFNIPTDIGVIKSKRGRPKKQQSQS